MNGCMIGLSPYALHLLGLPVGQRGVDDDLTLHQMLAGAIDARRLWRKRKR